MRTLFVLALLGLTVLAPAASASEGDHLVVVAKESGCTGTAFCFVVEGDMPAVQPGQELLVIFRNDGSSEHNLYVTTKANADAEGDTDPAVAIAHTETLGSGQETEITVQVPADAKGLYLWCEIAGHEGPLGMHLTVESKSAAGDGNDGSDGHDDTNEETGNGSPFPGVLALLAVFGLVAWRRRD